MTSCPRIVDHLLALALALGVVILCSLADAREVDLKEVDPHTATVRWSNGTTEVIHAQNGSYCAAIEGWILGGKMSRPPGAQLESVSCAQGGPYTGGSCIEGYVGPREEGYCR